MKLNISIIILIIILIGTFLRAHNLNIWPRDGATFDEYAWTFLGLSILNTGKPVSWSPHQVYKDKKIFINARGARFNLVTPYLEHPPLFGIVAGLFAKIRGAQSFNDVRIELIRPLAVILGMFSILMVYLLTSNLYGIRIGLIASALYAVIPSVVIGSRLVQNENFFIPGYLLCLFQTNQYIKKRQKIYLYPILILTYLLPLAKIPWVCAPIAVMVIFLIHRKYREFFYVGTLLILSIITYIGYGLYWDKEVFKGLMGIQLARYDMSFAGIFSILTNPMITDRIFLDGWIYFGWISILFLLNDFKKHQIVIVGWLTYLGMFLFAIPNEPGHGWYRYPFYPFLAIGAAYYLDKYFNSNYFYTFIFLLLTGLSMLQIVWVPIFGFSYTIYRLYLFLIAMGLIPEFFHNKSLNKLSRIINIVALIIVLTASLSAGMIYNEQ
jgi:4-amino-4-deoxy-L-arabinose transferase-like glycosyltransferase